MGMYQPEIETMDRNELEKLQLERLQKQVKNVYENVSYKPDIYLGFFIDWDLIVIELNIIHYHYWYQYQYYVENEVFRYFAIEQQFRY